jgi:hypothetical protein
MNAADLRDAIERTRDTRDSTPEGFEHALAQVQLEPLLREHVEAQEGEES